jgi:hypothetical protein
VVVQSYSFRFKSFWNYKVYWCGNTKFIVSSLKVFRITKFINVVLQSSQFQIWKFLKLQILLMW